MVIKELREYPSGWTEIDWYQKGSLEKIEQKIFTRFAGIVVSALATKGDISLIHRNPIVILSDMADPPKDNFFLSLRLHFNIAGMERKSFTKEQRDDTATFLMDGVENTLTELLSSKRKLDQQETRIVMNFKNMKTPEGNRYTVYDVRKLLEQHFSSLDDDSKKNPKLVTHRKEDAAFKKPKKKKPEKREISEDIIKALRHICGDLTVERNDT